MTLLNGFSIFLASEDPTLTDFLSQISGLLILTCGVGVAWVLLMAMVMQRAGERRRRAKAGLPPLPGFWVPVQRAIRRWLNPEAAASEPVRLSKTAMPPRMPASMPAPDLSMLTGGLPEPDLAAMVGDIVPDAEYEAQVEADFALDMALDAASDKAAEYVPAPEPESEPAPVPVDVAESGDIAAVLRVWRDVSDGSLLVEMGGRRFGSLADLRGADVARRFQNVVRDLAGLPETDEGEPVELPEMGGTPPPDAVELLRVWRDLIDGGLIVEVAGQAFRSVAGLQDAGQARRFQNVVRDLNALANAVRPTPPVAPATSPAPGGATSPARSPQPPAKPAPASKQDDDAARERDEDDDGIRSLGPRSMFRQMTRAAMGNAPEPMEIEPELSIADQIEDRLQKRLADLPEYAGRRIHVRPSFEGGVRIEVDGQYYDGVGAVADDAVRALLMEVVREWEQSQ